MKTDEIMDDSLGTESELRVWFETHGPLEFARQIHFDTVRFSHVTLHQPERSRTPRQWWAMTATVAILFVGLGGLVRHGSLSSPRPVSNPSTSHQQFFPSPLIVRPRNPIPSTILGKEEQLLSYQPQWIQQQWLAAQRPPIKFSTWAPKDTGGYGWYYFYTGPHSSRMMGENQVVLNVHPHLAWHGPIMAQK